MAEHSAQKKSSAIATTISLAPALAVFLFTPLLFANAYVNETFWFGIEDTYNASSSEFKDRDYGEPWGKAFVDCLINGENKAEEIAFSFSLSSITATYASALLLEVPDQWTITSYTVDRDGDNIFETLMIGFSLKCK